MAELLAYLGISTKKEYHAWCRLFHPDRSVDSDATRKFQVVSDAWAKVHKNTDAELILTEEEKITLLHGSKCVERVEGTTGNKCWRRRAKGSDRCFYHQPNTVHRMYVDKHEESFFFGMCGDYVPERGDDMCTARLANGRFCTGYRTKESLYCWMCTKSSRKRFPSDPT